MLIIEVILQKVSIKQLFEILGDSKLENIVTC
jgi:hypothetical protein